jgi:hypothetical protein
MRAIDVVSVHFWSTSVVKDSVEERLVNFVSFSETVGLEEGLVDQLFNSSENGWQESSSSWPTSARIANLTRFFPKISRSAS